MTIKKQVTQPSFLNKRIDPYKKIKSALSLRVEVEFGQPSKECAGLGICRIHLHGIALQNLLAETRCNRALASVSFTEYGRLIFLFTKSKACKMIKHKFFKAKYFVIKENVTLPDFIIAFCDYKHQSIRMGYYPIIETEDNYIVHLA